MDEDPASGFNYAVAPMDKHTSRQDHWQEYIAGFYDRVSEERLELATGWVATGMRRRVLRAEVQR
jgi:hypothetical protein